MKNRQPSSFLYIALGAVTIGASVLIIFILFASGIFKVTFNNGAALLLVGVIYGISLFSILTLLYKWHEGPERARVMQSHEMLTIANETLSHLRQGFTAETGREVAQIIFDETHVDAVAVLDKKDILAAVGVGAKELSAESFLDRTGGIDVSGAMTFHDFASAGEKWTGISVPLTVQGKERGTLEFLYLLPKKLTENRITVARGLGVLLSRQLELSELDKQQALAVHSELKALRAQINPHFLFNTLNTIAALCRTDSKTARRLIIKFADFFRESLERQNQFTTLDEELRYVNSYLVFERARFGDRLQIEWQIDEAARKAILPSLVLQPLVENAVKHGMAKTGSLHLGLAAKLDGTYLFVQVHDDGVGIESEILSKFDSQNGRGLGIGLNNVRERLRSLYGSSGLMNISSTVGEGTEVTLKIPAPGGINEN